MSKANKIVYALLALSKRPTAEGQPVGAMISEPPAASAPAAKGRAAPRVRAGDEKIKKVQVRA